MRGLVLVIGAFGLLVACEQRASEAHVGGPAGSASSATVALSASTAQPVVPAAKLRLQRSGETRRAGSFAFSEYTFSSEATTGSMWVVQLDLSGLKLSLRQAKEPAALSEVLGSEVPEAVDYAAVNGGFYGRDGRPMGLVVAEGRELFPKTRAGGSGIFLLQGGGASVVHRDAVLPSAPPTLALQSIDRIVDNARSVVRKRPELPRDARSAVAVRKDRSVLLIAAFDRRAAQPGAAGVVKLNQLSTSTGLTLAEFAELLAAASDNGGLGVSTALNLDGGFSTSMQFRLGPETRTLVAHRATTNALLAKVKR